MSRPVVVTEEHCACMAECLGNARALVLIRLDAGGRLIEANRGFRELIGGVAGDSLPEACGRYFLAPTLTDLLEAAPGADGLVYDGILNIGDPDRVCVSLTGAVYRQCGGLLVVAEREVAELESLYEQVLSLNEQLAETQRELLRINRRLQDSESRQRMLSHTDVLTGLANRRKMEERLHEEFLRGQRSGKPFAVCVVDIDYFKRVNDRYGHDAGDAVLRRVAELLAGGVRDCDLVARWGGEEFVILLPETTLAVAVEIAERLREALAKLGPEQIAWPVTVSIGVAAHAGDPDFHALVKRADQALYAAKQGGRNRVVADAGAS